MFPPQVLYVSPRLRGALTEDQFGALEVIEYIEHPAPGCDATCPARGALFLPARG